MALAVVAALCVSGAVVVAIARLEPRGEVSQSVRFLAGLKPTQTTMREEDFVDTSGTVAIRKTRIMIVEAFELAKSHVEVLTLAGQEDIIGISVRVGPRGDSINLYQLRTNPERLAMIEVQPIGPQRTRVEVTEELPENPLRRFFAWVRRVTGGS